MRRMGLGLAASTLMMANAAYAISIVRSPVGDTFITQDGALGGPASNHRGDSALWAGGTPDQLSYPLVGFDLKPYRGGNVTGTAQLRLFVDGGSPAGNGASRDVGIYTVKVPWNANDVTWDRFGPLPGVDFAVDAGPLLTTQTGIVWPGPGGRYITWDLPATVVQAWIDQPAANFGVLVRNFATAADRDLRFSSQDAGNAPQLTFELAARQGDFNNDAILDGTDIDLLFQQPSGAAPPGNPAFDLNGDGVIVTDVYAPNSDADVWVQTLTHTLYGDADFDGKVIFDDLLVLAMNYGRAGGGWRQGNFDGRNGVEFNDLLLLAQHYGQSAVNLDALSPTFAADWALAQSLVPEPSAVLGLASSALLVRRRRARH